MLASRPRRRPSGREETCRCASPRASGASARRSRDESPTPLRAFVPTGAECRRELLSERDVQRYSPVLTTLRFNVLAKLTDRSEACATGGDAIFLFHKTRDRSFVVVSLSFCFSNDEERLVGGTRGCAPSAERARGRRRWSGIRADHPDVAIVDLSLGMESGLQLLPSPHQREARSDKRPRIDPNGGQLDAAMRSSGLSTRQTPLILNVRSRLISL